MPNTSQLASLIPLILLMGCGSSSTTTSPANEIGNSDAVIDTRSCGVELSATGSFSDNYHTETVCGWTVKMHRDLFDDTLADDVFAAVNSDLKKIKDTLPESAANDLKAVTIWLELNQAAFPGGVYHPSADWLVDNGYPAKWAKGVQLGVAQNYLTWTNEQPAMLLHELAHAYDDIFFASTQPDLLSAFDAAVQSGDYELVEYINGGTQRAYALTNSKEYFAELTEAYFWKNDFFPFNREELLNHDATGYQALEIMWQP